MTASADDDGTERCVVCRQPADYRETEFMLELSNREESSIDLAFCSWGHLDEWVRRGEPDFGEYQTPDTWVDRVLLKGCLLLVLAMLALMCFGAWTLVQGLL